MNFGSMYRRYKMKSRSAIIFFFQAAKKKGKKDKKDTGEEVQENILAVRTREK